jgi:hypothetical protein
VPKWVKFIIGIVLLPACVGAAVALWKVIRTTGEADTIWVAALAGAACWIIIFLLLPKPMWVYVFGHELTHALWAWCFGGEVKSFRASSSGGHVVLTKSNFLIALAPYFFPVYVVVCVIVFSFGHWVWNWSRFMALFHLLVGAAYAFHLTLTLHVLRTEQSDITQQGYLFSIVVIFLGNVLVLLIGVPLLTARVELWTALRWWFGATSEIVLWIWHWIPTSAA